MLRGPRFNIPTFYDRGYYNTGIQPTENDLDKAVATSLVCSRPR